MKRTFAKCVALLEWVAGKVCMTYEEVNVWIFCVVMPIAFLAMLGVIIWQAVNCRC